MIEKAIEIASAAHQGQFDKAGEPYILHPLRVMAKLQGEAEKTVAVLHDVIEDTAVTLEDLKHAGFSQEIIEAVDAISRRENESYDDYITRVLKNSLASVVKLVDLEDNLNRPLPDEAERSRLHKRYERAKVRLIRGE